MPSMMPDRLRRRSGRCRSAWPAIPWCDGAGSDVLIEPARQRAGGAPRASNMVERVLTTDARRVCQQASDEERPSFQQLVTRMIARVSTRNGGEAVADELEAGILRGEQCCRQPRTDLVIDDRVAIAAELIRREPVVSGACVEAARGDVGIQSSSDRRVEVKTAVRSRLVRRRRCEAHVVLLTEYVDCASERSPAVDPLVRQRIAQHVDPRRDHAPQQLAHAHPPPEAAAARHRSRSSSSSASGGEPARARRRDGTCLGPRGLCWQPGPYAVAGGRLARSLSLTIAPASLFAGTSEVPAQHPGRSACWDCRARAEARRRAVSCDSESKAGSPLPMKSRISSKGQITVPVQVRDRARAGRGDRGWSSSSATAKRCFAKGGGPTHPVDRVYGRLRLGKPVDAILDAMRGPRPKVARRRGRRTRGLPSTRRFCSTCWAPIPSSVRGPGRPCGPPIARERSSRAPSSGPR